MRNKKINGWKSKLIIATALISIVALLGVSSGHLVQGQVNPNGTLWIVSYQNPTGSHYPAPFADFHANNLTLTVYSPLTTVQNANITVKSFTQSTNTTRYLNQSFTILPHKVQSFDLLIPASPGKQEISITWDNVTTTYLVQTYTPVSFPFGDNPLGLLAFVGIIMLVFTGLNIGLTKVILEHAKYFPKLTQRAWAALIIMSGLIIYNIIINYYYDLNGQDWALWLLPLWFFNLLMILSAWQGKEQEELYAHIKEASGDLETGLYAIRTAPMTEKEKGKYPIPNHSGKEYIDARSYMDFIRRLFGQRIPIIMDTKEQPDKISNPSSRQLKRPWKMQDRVSKEHPFKEAYLLDPLLDEPQITKLEIPNGLDRKGQPKNKKVLILLSHLNGKHMKEAEYFLADYVTASESGKEIHRLNKNLAINQASLNTKAYKFQEEIVDFVYDVINQKQTFQDFQERIITKKENETKPESKTENKERE